MISPDLYQKALFFAATAHGTQSVPSREPGLKLPYLVHLCSVASEVIAALPAHPDCKADLAVTCALLHDVVEDTPVSPDQLEQLFGADIRAGVLALTKNSELAKAERMQDSLNRIRQQPVEIWMVKLADRTVNMGPPPYSWDAKKRRGYLEEAKVILEALGEGSPFLADRLRGKILVYPV
jgi:(p)ppGpp synthase/HD superfamily hydrolase